MILAMKPNLTLDQSEIQNGDIICFQADISGDECVTCDISLDDHYSPFHQDIRP